MTDISELKAKDGKIYVSVIFDCFELMPLGLDVEDNMRASLCVHTLEKAKKHIWILPRRPALLQLRSAA